MSSSTRSSAPGPLALSPSASAAISSASSASPTTSPPPKRTVVGSLSEELVVASALGVAAHAIVGEPVVADHGVRFVLIETTRDALAAAVPNQPAIEALTEGPDAIGFYVYARDTDGYDATIRMFAPRYGIPEEAATGMGSGLLGGYLARAAKSAGFRFLQGALMPQPSPSELIVRVQPERTLVGGTANVIRTLRIPLGAA